MTNYNTFPLIAFVVLLLSCGKTSGDNPAVTLPDDPQIPAQPPTPTDSLLKEGLLFYYPFNNADDKSGNNYHLQINGPISAANRFGELKKAYDFNGVSDYMIIPPVLKADSLHDLSFSLWVRPSSVPKGVFISLLLPGGMPCSSYLSFDNSASNLRTHFQLVQNYTRSTCSSTMFQSSISDPQNKWIHIVLTKHVYVRSSVT